MAKQDARPADSRDMYAVHRMFRREFRALPELIRGTAAQDPVRTQIVADHVVLMINMLHAHHNGEDDHCWPKLVSRAPLEVAPIVELMQKQHEIIDTALQDAEQRASRWRESTTAADRDALADTAEALLIPLGEHLAAEEERMLPIIDRHLSADEWNEVGKASAANTPGGKVPLLFGLLLEEASATERALFKDVLGAAIFALMSRLGPIVLKRYRRKVFSPR